MISRAGGYQGPTKAVRMVQVRNDAEAEIGESCRRCHDMLR